MSISEATPDMDATPVGRGPDDRAFLGHPKGLGYLAFVAGCERFSYYSMQTLLVLYMVKYLLLPGRIENVAGMDAYRAWLGELPGEVAQRIGWGNGASLFSLQA